MKKQRVLINILVCLLALVMAGVSFAQEKKEEKHSHEEDHKFKFAELEKFHELLHPIWHQYYPAKEWTRIRAQGDELLTRKDAIMKVRLRTKAEDKDKVEELRKKFGASVDHLAAVAKSGTDEELQKAVREMHEAFENFAQAVK